MIKCYYCKKRFNGGELYHQENLNEIFHINCYEKMLIDKYGKAKANEIIKEKIIWK